MLTLASNADSFISAHALVVGVVSFVAAVVMFMYVESVRLDSAANRPGFSRLLLAVMTFPVVHPMLLLAQSRVSSAMGWGFDTFPTASFAVIWYVGVPAIMATIPTALALAVAWRRPAVGWLAVGTTAGLSVVLGVAAEVHGERFLVAMWAFGAPLVWLIVVCGGLIVLQPREWPPAPKANDPCPACGYSTAGLKQAVCPECGGSLSVQPAPGTSRTG